jgi:rare lipoprotein A
MPRLRRTAAAALVFLAAACASTPKRHPPAVGTSSPSVVEGLASWYGPGFNGKRTSNGERYDQDGLTAAHCCWPFGTRLRVTFLATGKSTVVRINDRMPTNPKGRIIDLSRGAARAIGLIGPGTGRVRLEVLKGE